MAEIILFRPLKHICVHRRCSSPAGIAHAHQLHHSSRSRRVRERDPSTCECRSPRPRVRKCSHIPWASRPHQIFEDPPRGMADARRPLPFVSRLASLKAAQSLGRERPLPLSRATKAHSCSRADHLYLNLPTASSLVLSSVMVPQNVSKSGVVLRKVQRNDKWVRRWLQVSGARSFALGARVCEPANSHPFLLARKDPRRHAAHRQSTARQRCLCAWSSTAWSGH